MKRDRDERREIEMEREERRNDFVEKSQTRNIRQTSYLIMIRQIPFGRKIRSKVQNLTCVFNYLHDSNSIFRPAGINSELLRAHTTTLPKLKRFCIGKLLYRAPTTKKNSEGCPASATQRLSSAWNQYRDTCGGRGRRGT